MATLFGLGEEGKVTLNKGDRQWIIGKGVFCFFGSEVSKVCGMAVR